MLTIQSLEHLPQGNPPLHLALGVFDGLHLGHQEVIRHAVAAAKRHGGFSGLLTFHPHPLSVLHPSRPAPPSLCHPDTRSRILAALGLDLLLLLPFNPVLAAIPAREFVDLLLANNVRTIAVGEDWRFGHNRSGDVTLLKSIACESGFQLIAVPPVKLHGHRISSTLIRQSIAHGELSSAREMLGRHYSVCGTVIQGAQLARSLGFPTANISPEHAALPPDGVWMVEVSSPGMPAHPGIANLGFRPTVNGNSRVLETHLFDLSANLYHTTIEVVFLHQLRNEIKFPSLEALKHQIHTDCTAARIWFENRRKSLL